MTPESPALAHPYEIVSVRRTEPPSGADGSDWHGYVITQGTNTIKGCRQGTLETVTKAVEEIVDQLNGRRLNSRGRVQLVIAPKRKTSPTERT